MSETNQNNLKMYLVFIWDNLHHLRKSVSFCDAADHFAAFNEINVTPTVFLFFYDRTNGPQLQNTTYVFFAFSGNFISFSGNEFSQYFSGHYSMECLVWEKV